MGITITLQDILADLQRNTGCTPEEAADFIHALTDTITESLLEDGHVQVKGVGEFRVAEAGDERIVEFKPDDILAQEVNSPFSHFEAVDICDGVTEAMLEDTSCDIADVQSDAASPEKDMITENGMENATGATEIHCDLPTTSMNAPELANSTSAETSGLPDGIPPVPSKACADSEDSERILPSPEVMPAAESVEDETDEPADRPATPEGESVDETYPSEEDFGSRRRHRSRREIVIIVLVGLLSLLAGLMAGHFGIPGLNINGVKSVKITAEEVTLMHGESTPAGIEADSTGIISAEESAEPETAECAPVEIVADTTRQNVVSAPEVVTDTVQGTNYLSRIARRHYGKDIFWVYIYEENKDKIQDPNNIRPGTVVVIPPAGKYGIDPGSKASIQNAERLSGKILNGES